MAVATNALTMTAPRSRILNQTVTPWFINATSADASGCEEPVAAPGAGYALVVERLIIAIGAAITVTVGSGKSVAEVEGDKIGPLGGAAGTYVLDFEDGALQLTTNKSLSFDASGAGTVCIYAEGFTKAV